MLWQRLIYTLAASAVLACLSLLLAIPMVATLQLGMFVVLLSLLQLRFSQRWQRLTTENFLWHLNRRFPDFEESAQLLLLDETDLTPLQTLQRDRTRAVYRDKLANTAVWQPLTRFRLASTVTAVCAVLALYGVQVRSLVSQWLPTPIPATGVAGLQTGGTVINNVSVVIEPPAYTGMDPLRTETLDLEVTEGSRVHWRLRLSPSTHAFALLMADGERFALMAMGDHWQTSATVHSTTLYRIVEINDGKEMTVGGVHSLGVAPDRAPVVRILEPGTETLEIPRDGPARFNSGVMVRDDFGVISAEILASVAKGSGEGVKFRDQKLGFDTRSDTGKGISYQRNWDLEALGMAPGDEVYFTVVAKDNKQPLANTGRSETVIIRWLDDAATGLAAEGLTIDFIPEFFKSQRQIIIDTEQLISDRDGLGEQAFRDTSYAVGQSQADLKQKYGQYLGDEFGEGPGEQLGVLHEIAADGDDQQGHTSGAENHADDDPAGSNKTIRTSADILERFGHSHGDPEIGPMTRRNPVALMKRAVGEMWQSEKHLLQAQPGLALPYEYEAWKYLQLARQADRIYVKRLGFEPPPVSEDRRLTGELDEIRSYRDSVHHEPENRSGREADQWLFREVYQLLGANTRTASLTTTQRDLLARLSQTLTRLSGQYPMLIHQAAMVEELLLAGHLKADGCNDCGQELGTTLWRLMDEGQAPLQHQRAAWYPGDDMVRDYQRLLHPESAGRDQP